MWNKRLDMAASGSEALARRRATYQNAIDAITFSLGNLWG